MPMEGVYTEQGGPFHTLRLRAMALEQPYSGFHPLPHLPRDVARQIADAWAQAAMEAERMGWVNFERECRADAERFRAYADQEGEESC